MRLVHLSDPHFGTTSHLKIAALFETLEELKPDLIVLTGDITQRARRGQFREARAFCAKLRKIRRSTELIALPGNHDLPLFNLPARLFRPYRGFLESFGLPLDSRIQVGAIELLAFNTTSPFRHVQGRLSREDLDSLPTPSEAMTDATPIAIRIVAFHHPIDCRLARDEKNLLKNARAAVEGLEAAEVDLVLSGHIHDPLARLSNERYPETERPFVICVAGTCLSSRTRAEAPNSFHLIDIEPRATDARLTLTRHDLSPQARFVAVDQQVFTRIGRAGWSQGALPLESV